jgi:uncharacterized membrane protein YidH (DUF202 family)
MKKLSSKIENAFLLACSLGLLVLTIWNFVRVFANLSEFSSTQVFDTILLTAILLMLQVAMVAIIPFNQDR